MADIFSPRQRVNIDCFNSKYYNCNGVIVSLRTVRLRKSFRGEMDLARIRLTFRDPKTNKVLWKTATVPTDWLEICSKQSIARLRRAA